MANETEMSLAEVLAQCDADDVQNTYANSGFKVPPIGVWDLQLSAVKPKVQIVKKTNKPTPTLSLHFEFLQADQAILDEFPNGFYHTLWGSNFGDNATLQKLVKCIDPTHQCGIYAADAKALIDGGAGMRLKIAVKHEFGNDPNKPFPKLDPITVLSE